MKVKSIHLQNFKRFSDLQINSVPETVKLVLVIGPNGSGKSSLFDAFIYWYRYGTRWGSDQDATYYRKGETDDFVWENTVTIETYQDQQPSESSLYVRTAYRNDADFTVAGISRVAPPTEELRVSRSIQNDQTVSLNYQRLVYETVSAVYNATNDTKSVEQLRNELIGEIRASMLAVFGDLLLTDISDPLGAGTFFFEKGSVESFRYKNLSGGEKAAFDLLLDLHLKKRYYTDAIWCIDELETHLHTRVQGTLMKEMFALVPETAQMWLTTHSLGVMRAAQELSLQSPGSVAILDFDGVNLDEPTLLVPSSLGRLTWEKMMSIATDDLSLRIMPSRIIVCEGSAIGTRRRSFDAEIYNRIFGVSATDVVFVSGGSSNQISASAATIRATLDDLTTGTKVLSLCDRDDKSDAEVREFENGGNLVLPERNLESYLLADDVLESLVRSRGQEALLFEVLQLKAAALAASVRRGNRSDDLKSAAGEIFVGLVKLLGLVRAGNDKDAFMRDTLAPLIVPGMPTYYALNRGIIDRISE